MALKLSISVGQMRTVALFRKSTPIQNETGGYEDNFADLLTTRCRFTQKKAKRSDEDMQLVMNRDFELVCRFQTALIIDNDTIVIVNGDTYTITEIRLDKENNKQYYILTVSKNG